MEIIRPLNPLDHSEMWLGRGREDFKKLEFNVSLRTVSGGFQRCGNESEQYILELWSECRIYKASERKEWKYNLPLIR